MKVIVQRRDFTASAEAIDGEHGCFLIRVEPQGGLPGEIIFDPVLTALRPSFGSSGLLITGRGSRGDLGSILVDEEHAGFLMRAIFDFTVSLAEEEFKAAEAEVEERLAAAR